jgi:hypothetical protein
MKYFWSDFKYFLFYPKFNFFDFWTMCMITTFAMEYSWWIFLLMIPLILFSCAMEWRVRKEMENAQAGNGTVR